MVAVLLQEAIVRRPQRRWRWRLDEGIMATKPIICRNGGYAWNTEEGDRVEQEEEDDRWVETVWVG